MQCLFCPLFSQIFFLGDLLLERYPDVWLSPHFSCIAALSTALCAFLCQLLLPFSETPDWKAHLSSYTPPLIVPCRGTEPFTKVRPLGPIHMDRGVLHALQDFSRPPWSFLLPSFLSASLCPLWLRKPFIPFLVSATYLCGTPSSSVSDPNAMLLLFVLFWIGFLRQDLTLTFLIVSRSQWRMDSYSTKLGDGDWGPFWDPNWSRLLP